ncbi:hypothetical protein DMC47_06060 [Nostoc sp. 3335mG]|nr:hypothetical protein DMC47_06060 [Nostoc sp. 3335mG]
MAETLGPVKKWRNPAGIFPPERPPWAGPETAKQDARILVGSVQPCRSPDDDGDKAIKVATALP